MSIFTRLILLLFALSMAMAAHGQATLAYWAQNNNALPSGGFGFRPASFPQAADLGSGHLSLENFLTTTGGADSAYTSIQSFTGTVINAQAAFPSGGSLSPQGGTGLANNGMSIRMAVSTVGHKDIQLSWAYQRTSTGFNSVQLAYSTNGVDFINFGAPFNPPTSFALTSFDFSAIAALNNNPNAAFRITLNGATNAGGNNRYDNITVNGTPLPAAIPDMRITEYLYSGAPGEFVEFTNTGTVPVDMTGWSFDDDSRTPGVLDLSAFGIVQPGESVIITEATEAEFRAAWNLCDDIKVIDGYLNNLGRNDEINLYDAAGNLADRLTFGDQTFPGSIRTQNAAGWVSAAGLGANDPFAWTLATIGDTEGSYASTGSVVGSPGTSTRATVTYSACGPADMRITEYMYSGGNGEFVEFTNVSTTPINMAGWSYDDSGRTPGAFDLSAFGTVQPGESVIITETTPAAFRTSWNLCNEVKVLGEYENNLGRSDEINLFDASGLLVDRLTYGDQTFVGSIRTQNAAGWVSAAGLGSNDPFAWTLATVGDAEGSYNSLDNAIGSPGKSTRAAVAFEPCATVGDAPVITLNLDATNNFLDAGLTASPNGSYAVSGVIGDPTDPMRIYGLVFDLSDADTDTDSLTVSVTSSNETVAPQANISLTGGPAQYTLTVVPAAPGFSSITISVSDGNNTSTFEVLYAASANGSTPSSTRWHTQAADASAAVAIDTQYAFVADDEDQTIRLFDRTASGLPLAGFDFTPNLALPDSREVDIEGAFRLGDRIFWIGSHGNGSAAQDRPSRRRLFATDIAGTGANATLSYVGRYDGLREDLTAWGDANGYNFSATVNGTLPTEPMGFNIEGLTLAPDGSTAFIGFRAPRVPLPERGLALIAPIQDFAAWFNNGSPVGSPTFGEPIELDLGGRAIRSLECNSNGCIIVAGSTDASGNFKLFTWSGEPGATPQPRAADLSELTPEALVELPAGDFMGAAGTALTIQLISDNGTVDYYGNGQEAKDLAQDNHKKFRSDLVVLGDTELPAPSIVAEAGDLDVECFGNGNTDELAFWLADNGGAMAEVFCGQGVWTNQLTQTAGDCATYTFTITDECGKTATTTATFCIEDTTPPALACNTATTVAFNGEATIELDFAGLVFSQDICSEVALSFDTESISCAQVGSIVPVLVTATDLAGNPATCTINVTVEGLPCGFSQNDDGINCNNGSDWSYDAAAEVFSGTSTNCSYGSPYTKDQMAYMARTLCGNGSITAQVTSIDGGLGWAGIVIRENDEANAKKAQLLTNLNAFNRREVRATTGGSSFPQNFTAQGRYWLRLVRQGNQVIGYVSANGVIWNNIMVASISMGSCVEVGLIVTNSNANTAVTATFANVSVEGASQLLAPVDMAGFAQGNTPQGSLVAYPNPSAGLVTLDVTAFLDQDATLIVQDAMGRTLRTESLGTLRHATEQVDLTGLPAGIYYLRLRLSGKEEHVQRIAVQPRP